MLRLSSANSGFGALDQGGLAQRVAHTAWLNGEADGAEAQSNEGQAKAGAPTSSPLFTRLWPSASFGSQALWQDTRAGD